MNQHGAPMRRRDLLKLIGSVAGSSVMYQAMTTLGLSAESTYSGPIALDGNPKNASVLILGAGLAGMVAALELRNAGYKVQVLEYQQRAGGRCWTMRGGDRYTELGGAEQVCEFDKDLYLNPGPVAHSVAPPRRDRLLQAARRRRSSRSSRSTTTPTSTPRTRSAASRSASGTSRPTSKAASPNCWPRPRARSKLTTSCPPRTRHCCSMRCATGARSTSTTPTRPGRPQRAARLRTRSRRRVERRTDRLGADAVPGSSSSRRSGSGLSDGDQYYHHSAIFQPVGGMDMIAKGFEREVGDLIRFNAKVTAISQDDKRRHGHLCRHGRRRSAATATADWCLCTIPLSVLAQIKMNVGAPMAKAISAVPYSPSFKIGLQFKRRFWEQDEEIYGGITYTDLPIRTICYPSPATAARGKGVLLGGYTFGVHAYEFTSLPPEGAHRQGARVRLADPSAIRGGVRQRHLGRLAPRAVDARLLRRLDRGAAQRALQQSVRDRRPHSARRRACLVHPGWQEGAILSALDAIARLHQRVLA